MKTGIIPANADSKPADVESWAAKTALDATLERETKGLKNPDQPSDENLNTALQDEEIWKIAMFLKQMDKLPPTVDAEWKKIPSVAVTRPETSE